MAQQKAIDLSEAETIDNFSIEDTTGNLGGEELDSYLNDEEEVTADPKTVTAIDPEKGKKPDPKKTEAPAKPGEPSEAEKLALKEKQDEEDAFDDFLEGEEKVTPGGKKPIKKPEETEEEETEETTDEGITSFAADLYKIGFFTKRKDDEKVPSNNDELLAKLEEEREEGIEEGLDEFASKHGEEYRKAFYDIFVSGAHPKEYLTKFEEIKSYKNLDMTIEANQVRAVEVGLRKQGWDETDIEAEIRRLKTNSDLEETSGRYHRALVKSEEAGLTKMAENAKVETARKEAQDKSYYDSLSTILTKAVKDKELNGIPVTKDLAQKAFDIAYTKKWTLPKSQEEITDLDRIFLELKKPEYYALRGQVALLFGQTFEGWDPSKKLTLDLSKIQKQAVSTETNDLFREVIKHKKGVASKTTPASSGSHQF